MSARVRRHERRHAEADGGTRSNLDWTGRDASVAQALSARRLPHPPDYTPPRCAGFTPTTIVDSPNLGGPGTWSHLRKFFWYQAIPLLGSHGYVSNTGQMKPVSLIAKPASRT
jgi:hypothetical protein